MSEQAQQKLSFDAQALLPSAAALSRGAYRFVRRNGRQVPEHRAVWEEAYGPIPPGMVIHHRNHDRGDNRLENLQMMRNADHVSLHHLTGEWGSAKVRQERRLAVLKRLGICRTCRDREAREEHWTCAVCWHEAYEKGRAAHVARLKEIAADPYKMVVGLLRRMPRAGWLMAKRLLYKHDRDVVLRRLTKAGYVLNEQHIGIICRLMNMGLEVPPPFITEDRQP